MTPVMEPPELLVLTNREDFDAAVLQWTAYFDSVWGAGKWVPSVEFEFNGSSVEAVLVAVFGPAMSAHAGVAPHTVQFISPITGIVVTELRYAERRP